MKVVSPFRPFQAESTVHQELGAFDWVEALRLMRASVQHSCDCEAYALTDVDTDLPVPMIQVETTERRLMLWIVEVTLRYLESPFFDQDTVLISPDVLVFKQLSACFTGGDLSIIVRLEPKFQAWPFMSVAQWLPVRSRAVLVALYQEVLAIARSLPEDVVVWGADSEPLRQLLEPAESGLVDRTVAGRPFRVHMLPSTHYLRALSSKAMQRIDAGAPAKWPSAALIDCRAHRKRYMARYFAATIGQQVQA